MKPIKRVISAIATLLLLVPLFVFPASADEVETISIVADGMNCYREAGALVIYTPEHGTTTGTNEWGWEVIVEDNKAIRVNKGDSPIPENGFVLSGHDDLDSAGSGILAGQWLLDNISVGDYVYVAPGNVITVSKEETAGSSFYSLSTGFLSVNGPREQDSIVIYNTCGSNTNTNDWGYEVICTGGFVSAMGGNNNRVPSEENSFIVSAHGVSVTWLQENVRIGMEVTYDAATRVVTFDYSEEAALKGAEFKLNALWKTYDDAIANYNIFDYTAAKTAIEGVDKKLEDVKTVYESTKDSIALADMLDEIEFDCANAAMLLSESPTVEYRGVWVRPDQTSAFQVDAYVQTLHDKGINTICVETLYDCTMIMPMPEDSLFEHNPLFNGVDILEAYIEACHKRDMELHIWLPVFYVGDGGSKNIHRNVGIKKPEWRSVSSNGRVDEIGGYVMLDPANQEVQEFLLGTYRYILENYDIDGFQLDYIRYFERTETYDMGYNEGAKTEFYAKYAQMPKYDLSWSLWDEWVQFRCDKVTEFVGKVRSLIDEVKPEVLLGADVVPDPTTGKTYNYQDYFKWLDEGLLDIVFPMAYGYGYEEAIKMQVESCGHDALIAVGLGIFMTEMTPEIMEEQANFNTSVSADGSVYFSSAQYLKKETGELLMQGVYRNPAITPTLDIKKATLAKIDYAKDRISKIMLPLEGINEESANKILAALDELKTSIESGYEIDGRKLAYNPVMHLNVQTAIDEADCTPIAWTRMNADLEWIIKAYSVQSKNGDEVKIERITKDDVDKYPLEGGSTSADESNADEGKKKNNSLTTALIIIGSCVLAAIIAVVVALLAMKKSSKKTESTVENTVEEPKTEEAAAENTVADEENTND